MFQTSPSRLKHILLSTLVSLALPITTGTADAISPADESKITVIEKRLFFKTYKEESIVKRMERLEKRFFGEPLNAEPEEQRLSKILEAAGPQTDADGTVSKGHLTPDPPTASTPPEKPPEKPPETRSRHPGAQYPKSGPQDSEVAWEKASMAAVSARDLEIRTLLKEAIRLSKRKETDAAIEKFNQVIRLDPQNAEAHFSLGVIFESKGQLQQALAAYKEAHDINPDRLDYKDAIVSLEQKGVKKNEAAARHADTNQLAKEAAEAFKRKEYMSALEMYKRLETEFPKNAPYKYNIGTLYLMMQNQVQALEYYEMARKLNPKEERYVTACTKLKESLKADETKRKEVDAQWDAKEKADRERERARQKASGQGGKGGKAQKNQPGRGPVQAGKPMQSGFQQPPQQAIKPPANRQPVYQPPQQQMPPGYPPMNTGYQKQQPGGYNQMPGGYNQQPGQMPQGYNQQPGFNAQPGFNQQPPQQGFNPQPGYNQQGYGGQPQQPAPGQPNYGGNQMQPGFNYQPGFNQQQMPPGFAQPGQQNQVQPQFQQQPGFNQSQPGFNQGYPNQGQAPSGFNQQSNQTAYASNSMPPGFSQGGQQGLSQLTQPAGYVPPPPNQAAPPPTNNNMAPTGTGPDPLANLGILAQPSPKGVSITTVGIGSRAAKAKLSKGDIIVAVDGVNVTTMAQIKSVLGRKQPGESAQLIIDRKGKVTQIVL